MKKAIEILEKYVTTKRDDYKHAHYDNKLEYKFDSRAHFDELKEVGPFTEEEAFAYRTLGGIDKHCSGVKFLDSRFHNKRFSIGDFEITVTYLRKFEVRPTYSNSTEYNSSGYKSMTGDYDFETSIYLNYHGKYQTLIQAYDSYNIQAAYCKPTQTNWHWLKPTEKKPYIMKELNLRGDYDSKISFLEELFSNIDIDSLELLDAIIEPQNRWEHSPERKVRPVSDFTSKEIDIEWFVKQEIKDGVYRPEGSTIAKWIYDGFREHKKYDKKLLHKLGVHTIQLRADAHFSPESFYDMKGISVKAPKTVIERYGLQKYCKNKEIVEKIKQEQKTRELEYKAREFNSKFTLMQHGKVVKNNKSYYEIIEYLQNFTPSSKMPKEGEISPKSNIRNDIIDCIQPVFDDFEGLDKFYIAYWGRYFKYECRGEICDINYECEYLNRDLDDETLEQIIELYESNICPSLDDNIVASEFGWPDRGGLALGVKREGNKLVVFTEDYDFE